MTAGWVIAVPCWGHHYSRLFLGPGLRSIRAALARLRDEFSDTVPVRFVIQTDDPVPIMKALRGFEVTVVPMPESGDAARPYTTFAQGHRHAVETARPQERIALLCADMLVSVEAFAASERRFRDGYRAIVAASSRSLAGLGRIAPMASRELLQWTMTHRHPIIESCFWGTGHCHLPWGVYFKNGKNIVLRAFHLHPFACVNDRDLKFTGTVDMDLFNSYSFDETHVVTDPDEMSFAEISPRSKQLALTPWPIDTDSIAAWALRGAHSYHWWNFRHRIAISGDPAEVTADLDVAAEVLRLCPYPESLS